MNADISRRDAAEPEPRPTWRTRVERQRIRDAWTTAECAKIQAVGNAEADIIAAAGRAQLHANRARYTAALTVATGEEFKGMHRDMARLRATDPSDEVLAQALAEILYTGFEVLKSHLEDHRRDGRERFR
jgi:hypothetical protein